jgi:hypothetical protein
MKFSISPYKVQSCAMVEVGYKPLHFDIEHFHGDVLDKTAIFEKLCDYITYIRFDHTDARIIQLFKTNHWDEKELVHQLTLSVDDYNTLKVFFEMHNDTLFTDDIMEILKYLCKF